MVRRICREKGYSATRKFGMISDADLIWNESSVVNADILSRMKVHQKLNHFPGEWPINTPGMYNISRKNLLAYNLKKMWKRFPKQFNFFPMTYCMPMDRTVFEKDFRKNKNVNPVNFRKLTL